MNNSCILAKTQVETQAKTLLGANDYPGENLVKNPVENPGGNPGENQGGNLSGNQADRGANE